jgi:hypothetical protein
MYECLYVEHYVMELNGGKIKVMRISRRPSPVHIIIDQKQPENEEYLKYLDNMITNDIRSYT